MKHITTQIAALLLSLLLSLLSVNIYAQKNADNDYNLKKAYEVLNDEKDEVKALDLVNKQLRETPDNVDTSVVKSQKAPLLLGQSAMERFGTITIDNQNNKLIIKH